MFSCGCSSVLTSSVSSPPNLPFMTIFRLQTPKVGEKETDLLPTHYCVIVMRVSGIEELAKSGECTFE